MHRIPAPAAALAALLFVPLVACDIVREGEEGNFYFRYDHQGIWSLSTPIAKGASTRVIVLADEEGTERVLIRDAEVDAVGILDVDAPTQDVMILRGQSAGEARVTVTAADAEGTWDATTFEVRDPDRVELRLPNPFNEAPDGAVFAAGGTARIPFEIEAEGTRLIGYDLPDFTSEPVGNANFGVGSMPSSVQFLHVGLPVAGTVALQHPLATDLELEVVEANTITSLAWRDFGVSGTVAAGTEIILLLRAEQADETPVMGLDDLASVTATTATCDVVASDLWGDGTFIVSPHTEGDCTVTASFLALSAVYEIVVGPASTE